MARKRESPEVNAGSMADIAFLLLIFFLVTTTIDADKGIMVQLPPWSDEPPDPTQLNERNVFSVLINANDDLLVRGEPADIDLLRDRAKEFILNPQGRPDLSEKPTKAIISLKNDRGTQYDLYIEVYNELKAAYDELWEEQSQKMYGTSYEDLPTDNKKAVRAVIPLVLSEAEPTDFGDE
ncbi:ExbD/TolR family protein [Membranihabitans maritimus]|uniref:ExbD/TolR family protein n=1 Tax=Membranihabitans maritimus TaxID=2904244 RepID=UPI001F369C80|nr:biopolymer transporter ExbD [Membranihabitans maritimus]